MNEAAKNLAGRWLAWASVPLGLAFAAATVSLAFVFGHGPFWDAMPTDATAAEIGWFYYARDAWRFPLFAIGNYHLPEGTNLLLSAALPLFAPFVKLAYQAAWPAGAPPPIYMGVWVALCFVLQVVAASRLLRALGIRTILPHLGGLALICYMPMLFLRFGHQTLLAHFFLLAALEGYVTAKRDGLTQRHWVVLCALPVLALLVQPYLVAMCGPLVLVTILDQWRERRIAMRGVLLRLGAMAFSAAVVMWISGFSIGAAHEYGDYGQYSLNLLSPLIPFPDTLAGRWLGTTYPSIPGAWQWEGNCYLGAGGLLLCVAALPGLRGWRAGLRRHALLIAMLAAMLLFAISNRIGFGSHELLHVPLPDWLIGVFSVFRGSGRFAWLPVYALFAAALVAVVRNYNARTATVVLIVAAAMQFVDVAPMQHAVRVATASPTTPTIDRSAWRGLIAEHTRLFQYPSFECGGLFGGDVPGTRWRELEIDWIVAEHGKPINSAYLARSNKDCDAERKQAARDHGVPGVLYLYRSTEDVGAFLAGHGVDLRGCRYLDDVVVCTSRRDLASGATDGS
jgi:hypothetical protein